MQGFHILPTHQHNTGPFIQAPPAQSSILTFQTHHTKETAQFSYAH